jgi:hypothetical protein
MKTNSTYFFIAIIVGITLLYSFTKNKEKYISPTVVPSKCYSCEQQYPSGYEWMGQKNKCFSCQKQLFAVSQGLPQNTFDQEPVKYSSVAKLGYMA